jgi:enterochelin esterase-like enzyme
MKPTFLLLVFLVSGIAAGQALTPASVREALAKPRGEAASVAAWIRSMAKGLAEGMDARVTGLDVAWAIEAPSATTSPKVVSEDGKQTWTLLRLGDTPVYALAASLRDGTGIRWRYEVDGRPVGGWRNLEVYNMPPESVAQPMFPRGTVTQMPRLRSKVFEGTERDWWVYVPAQYKSESPACVMVFQDGQGAKDYVPTYFDNLIAKGDMPVTVGVFVSPGVFDDKRSDRSREYDTLSDAYVRFLLEEVFPEVEKMAHLRTDPASRAIAGMSSGGICAFTAAWQRPDVFGKVLSFIGSFTDIAHGDSLVAGGHNYPALIRLTPAKPMRVFLQDGDNDLDNQFGNWWLSNLQMAKALEFAKYDYKFVGGHGFHSDRHGRAILADALRWLWRP